MRIEKFAQKCANPASCIRAFVRKCFDRSSSRRKASSFGRFFRLVLTCAFVYLVAGLNWSFSPSSVRKAAKQFKTLAVVYPQYHPVPENDAIYGVGFVEWTLLKKAPDQFMGLQTLRPHHDIGHYNLLSRKHRRNMRMLAQHFEIDGFIWYHYYLNRTYELNRPAELMLLDGEPNLPFCFCYANEDWSRNWDGSNRDVVLKHSYGNKQDMKDHFAYLREFFQHKNYVQLQGKPVVMIYRVEERHASELQTLIRIWNTEARNSGLKGIKFLRFLGPFDNSVQVKGLQDGVLFQPGFSQQRIWKHFEGKGSPIFDHFDPSLFERWNPELSQRRPKDAYLSLDAHGRSLALSTIWSVPLARVFRDISKYKFTTHQHPGLVYSWSNHPRRQIDGKVSVGHRTVMYSDSSYEAFLKCARRLFKQVTSERKEKFVVLTAWNEWNEQAVFEPSEQNGYLPLLAIQKATISSTFLPPLGRVIHVSHLGGGTERYVHDLTDLFPRYEHILASSEADLIENLNKARRSLKHDRLILHIHSVFVNGGVGRKILSYAKEIHKMKGRVVLTVHDFQWVVPQDPNRITRRQPSSSNLDFAREILLVSDIVIFPSNFVLAEYSRMLRTLDWYNHYVVPHPDYAIDKQATWVPEIDERISLCFLGEFSLRKGAHTLETILRGFENIRMKVQVYVHGIVAPDARVIQKRLERHYGVIFKGQYDETFIVDELRRSNIHVIALLSAVNETYCYVLTQALNTGIAILHTGAGAIGERLQGYERAFEIRDEAHLKQRLRQLIRYLHDNEGTRTQILPTSEIVQPNIWYIENYPLHKE